MVRCPATKTSSNTPATPGSRWRRPDLLSPHYVRTLDIWAQNLEEHRDDAIAVTSEQIYERYMRYLMGCSDFFQRGICEVGQFALVKG